MKGLVIKFDGVLVARELEDIKEGFKSQLENDGFIVIDNRFEIFEVDTAETREKQTL